MLLCSFKHAFLESIQREYELGSCCDAVTIQVVDGVGGNNKTIRKADGNDSPAIQSDEIGHGEFTKRRRLSSYSEESSGNSHHHSSSSPRASPELYFGQPILSTPSNPKKCGPETSSDVNEPSLSNTLQVHRFMLTAVSDIFAAMFSHDSNYIEAKNRLVEIWEFDVKTVHHFIGLIYGVPAEWIQLTESQHSLDDLLHLLRIAHYYNVKTLIEQICLAVTKVTGVEEHAREVYALAYELNLPPLQKDMTYHAGHGDVLASFRNTMLGSKGQSTITVDRADLTLLFDMSLRRREDSYSYNRHEGPWASSTTKLHLSDWEDILISAWKDQRKDVPEPVPFVGASVSFAAMACPEGMFLIRSPKKKVYTCHKHVAALLGGSVMRDILERRNSTRLMLHNDVVGEAVHRMIRLMYGDELGVIKDFVSYRECLELSRVARKFSCEWITKICIEDAAHWLRKESGIDAHEMAFFYNDDTKKIWTRWTAIRKAVPMKEWHKLVHAPSRLLKKSDGALLRLHSELKAVREAVCSTQFTMEMEPNDNCFRFHCIKTTPLKYNGLKYTLYFYETTRPSLGKTSWPRYYAFHLSCVPETVVNSDPRVFPQNEDDHSYHRKKCQWKSLKPLPKHLTRIRHVDPNSWSARVKWQCRITNSQGFLIDSVATTTTYSSEHMDCSNRKGHVMPYLNVNVSWTDFVFKFLECSCEMAVSNHK